MPREAVAIAPLEPQSDRVWFEERVAAMLAGIEQVDGPARSMTHEGAFYTCIASFPWKEEGGEAPVIHLTLEACTEDFCRRLGDYLRGKKKIWWRVRPEIDWRQYVYLPQLWTDRNPPSLSAYKSYKAFCRLYAE